MKKIYILTYYHEGEIKYQKVSSSRMRLLFAVKNHCIEWWDYDDEYITSILDNLLNNGSYCDNDNYDEWTLVEGENID